MSADLFSSFLGMTLQATGNNNNAWGTILNGSALQTIEKAICGNVTHAVTGGTLALDGTVPPAGVTPALEHVQIFTGVLASKQIVQMPNISKTWYIFNNTTGAFPLHVKTAAGNPTEIAQGTGKYVVCDGANDIFRLDKDSVGDLVHNGAAARPGTLACDGTSYLKTDHPDLFSRIGTTYGTADGLHFTVPLLTDTGRFLRSATGSLAIGTYQANLNASHSHTVTGAPGVGSLATDSQGSHVHGVNDPTHNHAASTDTSRPSGTGINPGYTTTVSGSVGVVNIVAALTGITIAAAGAHVHNVTGAPSIGSLATATSGGAEARPEALAVYIGIVY